MVRMRDKARGNDRMSGDTGALRPMRGDALMTPITPPFMYAALGSVETELVDLLGKAFTRDVTRRLR